MTASFPLAVDSHGHGLPGRVHHGAARRRPQRPAFGRRRADRAEHPRRGVRAVHSREAVERCLHPASRTGRFTTVFGTARSYNGGPATVHHSGTDFAADEGTPVIAAATGRVAYVGLLTTRGNSVIIDHGAGVFTAYHHLSRIGRRSGRVRDAGRADRPRWHDGPGDGAASSLGAGRRRRQRRSSRMDEARRRSVSAARATRYSGRRSALSSARSNARMPTRCGTGCRTARARST